MELNVAIVGNDEREVWVHLRAWDGVPDASVEGIFCDSPDPRLSASIRKWGRIQYRSFDDVMAADATIVVLLESCEDRQNRALRVLHEGKHLLMGPPFAADPAAARQIVLASEKSRGLLMSYENRLFYPPMDKVMKIIRGKSMGRVTAVRMRSLLAGAGGWDPWLNPAFRDFPAPAPPVFSSWLFREFFEKLSISHFVFGEIRELHCFAGPEAAAGARSAALTWKHSSFATYGVLDATYSPGMRIRSATWPRDDNMEFTGTSGIIWLTLGCSQMKSEPAVRIYRGENQFAYGNLDDDWISGYECAARHFARCVAGNMPPLLEPKRSALAVEYACAAMKSAETGERIITQ